MDFKDSIKQLTERIKTLKDNLQTEEATKASLLCIIGNKNQEQNNK